MKRPTKIRILGIDYRIRYVDRKCDVDSTDVAAEFGELLYDPCIITIATCRREELIQTTLLHEAIHAIDYRLKAGLTEQMVNTIAEGLGQVMRDNGGRLTG